MLRTEGHAVREIARIGAAAHRVGLRVFAGDSVVNVHADLYRGVIDAHVKRSGVSLEFDLRKLSRKRGDSVSDLLAAGVGGIAAVDGLEDVPVLNAYHAADYRKRLELAVIGINAEATAVPALVQLHEQAQELLFLFARKLVFENIAYQHAYRVHRALRLGCVAADALCGEVPQFSVGLDGDALGRSRLCALHPCLGLAGDNVARNAAADVRDLVKLRLGDDAQVAYALFAVADREAGIRAETEHRSLVIVKVVFHIAHAGLLVGTEQRADAVAQRDARVLEVLERVQAQDGRPLVVHYAAADEIALALAQRERVARPALADGDNIKVRDGGEVILRVADLAVADLILAVDSLESQLAAYLKPQLQRLLRPLAEGCTRLCRALDAVYRHKARDVSYNILSVVIYELVDTGSVLIIHCSDSFIYDETNILFFPEFFKPRMNVCEALYFAIMSTELCCLSASLAPLTLAGLEIRLCPIYQALYILPVPYDDETHSHYRQSAPRL